MEKNKVVFDIDGTLSIVGDRLKCLNNKDWDQFYARCSEDEVNEPVAALLRNLYYCGYDIVYVTGRREICRKDTLEWLRANKLPNVSTSLFMRKNKDYRPDTVVKLELVSDFIGDILMVFEDRSSVVKEWRRHGITCLQVANGDF